LYVIKRTVIDFNVEKKVVPKYKKLFPVIKEKINFPWEEQSLRRVLQKIGFKRRKYQSKRIVLAEKPSIV
jgi:hypothetical protein